MEGGVAQTNLSGFGAELEVIDHPGHKPAGLRLLVLHALFELRAIDWDSARTFRHLRSRDYLLPFVDRSISGRLSECYKMEWTVLMKKPSEEHEPTATWIYPDGKPRHFITATGISALVSNRDMIPELLARYSKIDVGVLSDMVFNNPLDEVITITMQRESSEDPHNFAIMPDDTITLCRCHLKYHRKSKYLCWAQKLVVQDKVVK